MIKSAEGSAGLLHKITKPTPYGGEEHRCEVIRLLRSKEERMGKALAV